MLIPGTILTFMLVAVSAVVSATETAVLLMPAGRVHRLVEAGAPGSDHLDLLVERRHRLRSVSALVAGSAYCAAGWLAAAWGARFVADLALPAGSETAALVASAACGVLGVLVTYSVAQALPRTLAVANPERIALTGSGPVGPIVAVVYPIASVFGMPWRWAVETVAKEPTITPWAVTPEFRGSSAGDEGEREEAEEALLEAVSDFAEKVAREVMVPRTDVAALADTATVAEAIALIHKTGYSRLPVFHESIDDVRGVLYAKDLLVALGRGRHDVRIAEIARPPFHVPETKPVEELLFEMRLKTHIAIVADEYGGTSGIVTLEDLLEEIVGEISDEYDREDPLVVDLGDGKYRVDARLPVDDLNELFGTDLDTEADSVGGLFTELVGRIPELGESMEVEGLVITVIERQGTRICQLTVEPATVREQGDTGA